MEDALRQFALQVIQTEAAAVLGVAGAIDDSFERAARMILDSSGSLLTSGVGKAGIIARKLSASFSSTGTPSHFLNPADAVHGDVGSIRRGDVVLILSDSGETDELLRMLNIVKRLEHPVIAITAVRTSTLARFSDITLA